MGMFPGNLACLLTSDQVVVSVVDFHYISLLLIGVPPFGYVFQILGRVPVHSDDFSNSISLSLELPPRLLDW